MDDARVADDGVARLLEIPGVERQRTGAEADRCELAAVEPPRLVVGSSGAHRDTSRTIGACCTGRRSLVRAGRGGEVRSGVHVDRGAEVAHHVEIGLDRTSRVDDHDVYGMEAVTSG